MIAALVAAIVFNKLVENAAIALILYFQRNFRFVHF